jgi:hypothetical protein
MPLPAGYCSVNLDVMLINVGATLAVALEGDGVAQFSPLEIRRR